MRRNMRTFRYSIHLNRSVIDSHSLMLGIVNPGGGRRERLL